jgi:glycosyltransferase involved in cell wall biosynthesis
VRILVLQNGLKSRSTHFYNESLAWRRLCRARNIPLHLLAHREASRELLDELGAVAAFPAGPDATFLIDENGTRGRPQAVLEEVFAEVCRRAFADKTDADDLVVVPYARVPELGGLARWLADIPATRRPFVTVLLHRPEEDWHVDASRRRITGNPRPMQEAAARLRAVASRGLLILATNAPLARILRSALGQDVTVTPPLYAYDFQARWFAEHGAQTFPTFQDRAFDLGLLGQMRPEKGGAVALSGIRQILARRDGLKVALHVRDDADQTPIRDALADLRGAGQVTLLTGELGHDAFLKALGACRIVVLPYHPDRYRARLSGPLVEAAAWGRPVVVPADTWMADMVAAGTVAGTIYPEHTPQALCAGVLEALDRYPALARQAQGASVAWRSEQSIGRALDLILARRAELQEK